MRKRELLRNLVGLAIGVALVVQLAPGQAPGPQTPTPSPAPPSGGTPTSPTPGGRTPSIPTTPTTPTSPQDRTRQPDFGAQPDRTTIPEIQRSFFFSGRVMMDDGTPPPDSIVIERVCNGVARPEAYTDSKGRFSFQLGQGMNVMPDASVSSGWDPVGSYGTPSSGTFGRSGRGVTERDLTSCELRASLPGFRSDVVNLAGRRMLDNPDVGTIILHRLGGVEGTTISVTSLLAPKDAKKAYDKGREALKRKKIEEALAQFEKAVLLYPKYAVAWFELGSLHQQRKQVEPARKAYAQALAADARFVKPYLELATLSVQERNWQDVADTTSRVLKLNPFDFPAAYFYNSVANFNLRNFEAAEKSAREALKLDTQHRVPKVEHLLGVILANKQDYAGAVAHMKNYLELAPGASDVDVVKKQLVDLEKFSAARTAAQPQPPPQ